ncbi:hypothetical protein [Bartonella vinsonii]
MNLVVDQLHNTAAEGSITGDAHFEAKTVGGDPLGALLESSQPYLKLLS